MRMKQWNIDAEAVNLYSNEIKEAAAHIAAGRNIAFPTETVYGLGADAAQTAAVDRIFEAKGRPSDNPLIVHIGDANQLHGIVDLSHHWIQRLITAFWPGPLTLVLPLISDTSISPSVTAGLPTLAVRMPDHPIALELIRAADCLIAAPSANRSGKPSPTRAEHVIADLSDRIDGIIDGGPTGVGLESTVIELADNELRMLRLGAITPNQLSAVLPEASWVLPNPSSKHTSPTSEQSLSLISDTVSQSHEVNTPRSPGLKYTHYAPTGKMTLVKGTSPERVRQWIQQASDAAQSRGEKTGILTYDEHKDHYEADVVLSCGTLRKPYDIAQSLYHTLRLFDEHHVSYILAEACHDTGIGHTILSRLEQAASYNVVDV